MSTEKLDTLMALHYLNVKKGYSIKPSYFKKLNFLGKGPAYERIGKYCMFKTEDLDAWLEAKNFKRKSKPVVKPIHPMCDSSK